MRIFLWFQCPLAGIFRGMGKWPDTYCTSVKFTVGWGKFKPPDFHKFPHAWIAWRLLLFTAITDRNQQCFFFFHSLAFLCNYSSFIYLFCCGMQAPEALPWNEIKNKIHVARLILPPTNSKENCKKADKQTSFWWKYFFYLVDRHFFQRWAARPHSR